MLLFTILTFFLTVNPTPQGEYLNDTAPCINGQITLVTCDGNQVTLSAPEGYDSYQWSNGSTLATATYTVNGTTTANCLITSATGCQAILCAALLTQSGPPTVSDIIYDTVCEGESYTDNYFNLPPQNEIGTHVFYNTFFNIDTCGSSCHSTTLYLTVQQHLYHIYDTACVGQNYNIFGLQLSDLTVGERLISRDFHRNNGCDSSVTLHLKVEPPFTISNTITGDTAVCRNGYDTYILPNANNFASFHWNVPEGVNVIGGQETPVVSLSFTDEAFTPAQITVIGTHLCGIDSVSLSVTHFPVYDIVIQDRICIGDEYHRYGFDLAQQDSVGMFTYTHSDTTAHGCDSVVTLRLTVNQPTSGVDEQVACDSLIWLDGITYYESTYDVITNTVSLTAPTFTIAGGAANGCDSIVTLHLTVNNTAYGIDEQIACDSLTWLDGITYYESTYDVITNTVSLTAPTFTIAGGAANGCDSVVTLHLTVKNTAYGIDEYIVCDSLTWLNGITYTESTDTSTYTYVNGAANGCDSIVTLHLTVNNTAYSVDDQIACDSLMWIDGITYYASTNTPTYTYVGGASNGCDSIVTLHLTVNNTAYDVDEQVACDSLTWLDGITYYASTNTPTYTYINGAANGCDSIVTLHLTVNNTAYGIDELTACDSLTWLDGITYYSSTNTPTYTYVGGASNGCDSIVTLHLTVNNTAYGIDEQIACDSLTWIDGITYYASTNTPTYTYPGGAANGCDSVVTLNLTVNQTAMGIDLLIASDSLTWIDGVTYYTSTIIPTYTYAGGAANGCDSIVTLHLTVNNTAYGIDEQIACDSLTWLNGITYTESTNTPTYTYVGGASNGCDSIVILHLTINYSTHNVLDTIVCERFDWHDSIYTTTGIHIYEYTNANDCASADTLYLTVLPNISIHIDSTVCESELPLIWNSLTFTIENVDTVTHLAIDSVTWHLLYGVDSTVVMTLHVNPLPQVSIDGPAYLCENSSVVLTADSAAHYLWSTGDTTRSIEILSSGNYAVTITDTNGCVNMANHHVSLVRNPIQTVDIPEMCAGGSYLISVGYQDTNNLVLGHGNNSLVNTATVFLPNGVSCGEYGCSYRSPMNFTAFDDDDTIRSAEDIYYLRLNIEHSCIGDLYVNLTCPNGQKADVLKYYGQSYTPCSYQIPVGSRGWQGGASNINLISSDLGMAYAQNDMNHPCDPNRSLNAQGIGWNYCWSNNTSQDYTYAPGAGSLIYRAVHVHNGRIDSSDVVAGSQFYHPDQSFESLVGCPLNGLWYVEVMDGWQRDNGYLFEWELAFNEELLLLGQRAFESATADGPWITNVNDSVFVVTPPETLAYDTLISYTFHVYDDAGCQFDTTVTLIFHAQNHNVLDTIVCKKIDWHDSTYSATGTYTYAYTNTYGCSSVDTLHLTITPTPFRWDTLRITRSDLPYHFTAYDTTFAVDIPDTSSFVWLDVDDEGCDTLVMQTVLVYPDISLSVSGTINTDCAGINSCNAIAVVTVNGGMPPYSYQWNDPSLQTTDTAFNLCEGIYTVIVTDALGNVDTAEVSIANFVPEVSHGDTTFCFSDSSAVLQGFPAGGTYSGANFMNNVLIFEENVMEYQLTYTYVDSNGCSGNTQFQVQLIPSSYGTLDTTVFENDLPLWLNGYPYSTDSIFTQILANANAVGCDSLLTVYLTVLYNVTIPVDSTICETELPMSWNGVAFVEDSINQDTHTITQSATLPASTGVDSTVVMTVNLLPVTYGTIDTVVLENDLPLWMNGVAYSTDTTFNMTLAGANDNGCDSVVTVIVTVLYNDAVYVDTTICDDDFPFIWNGVVFNTAGTQNVVYPAANGVDSVVTMTVNYNSTTYGFLDTTVLQNDLPFVYYGESYSIPGIYTQTIENAAGCDSIVTINLEEIYNVVAFADTVVCAINTPFEWNGYIFTQTATQMVILPASTGADSMLVMTVTVVYTTYGNMDTTVVENDLPFVLNGESYTTQGYKIQFLRNHAGCDSVLTINLHILYNVTVPADSTVCERELPMVWNGQSFDAEDIQAVTHTIIHSALLTASTGVDSTVVMTLHVLSTTYATIDTIVLENDLPLQLNGQTYMTDSTFTQTLAGANVNGCDSILTVSLTVRHNVITSIYDTICENQLPFTWNGVLFEEAGVQDTILTASTGVDSTVVMTLLVNPITYGTLDTIVLENNLPLQLNGQTYMTDSTFTQTLVGANANGCDSVLTVNLTIRYNVMTTISDTICESQLPFIWNDISFVSDSINQETHTITQSAILTASTGVDSTVVMMVSVLYTTTGIDEQVACDSYTWIDGQTYTSSTETATYVLTNEVGCDSVVTLHLTVYHSETSQDTLVLVENQLPYYFATADTTIAEGAPDMSQFSYHLSTIHECDSTIEQTVIIHYNTSATLDTMVCAASLPYTWHGHVFTEAGVYTDTLLNNNGSSHYLTLHLTVSNPTVTMQNITHINCYGASTGSVGVLVSGGVSPYTPIHWENEAGTTVSTTAQLNNQPAGKYRLFVTDALGCQVTDSVILTHLNDSMVPGVIAANQGVCEGTHLQTFTGTAASGGAGSVYQWQISTNGTTWNPAPTPNNSQNYNYAQAVNSPFSLRRAWISAACGTVYSNVVNVIVYHSVADTIYDVVCQGYPYQGNGFDISATATSTPGVLPCSIHLQSMHGCDSMVTLFLNITPSSYAEESLTICQSELPYTYNDTTFLPGTPHLSTFNFHLSTSEGCDSIHTLHLTVNPVYELNFEDVVCEGDAYDNHGFVVPSTQTVGVPELNLTQQLQSQQDCDSIVNLHLRVVDTAIAIVSLTSDFCEEYSAELSVETNMTNYLWSTGETSPTITVTQPGTYTVTAMQDHCSVSTWYQIETCELNVYLPNAITPNGDGINDYFCLHEKYLPMIEDFEIRIYTRWGELIYYSDDKNFKWNGEYRGRINRNIIYTYLINFTDNRGIPYQLTGTITVL